jgi:hypothetical protein
MKTSPKILVASLFFLLAAAASCFAQAPADSSKLHIVVKHDGIQFIGRIISQDAREVLMETSTIGQVVIPKYEIKEIREVHPKEFSPSGQYIPNEVFSTRYFITTNGLPIEKGESYIQWNLYGPDVQFGVAKNFGIGVMTTWVACPIIVSAKYSIKLSKKTSLGLGTLLGTGSWTAPDFGLALPFAALTFGDRKANISFSAGYGAVTYKQYEYDVLTGRGGSRKHSENRMLMSTAFMFKVGPKVSFVFDTFIVPKGKSYYTTEYLPTYNQTTGLYQSSPRTVKKDRDGFALVVPGIRWQMDSKRAFQFGFSGIKAGGEWMPMPVPMVQWFRKI